MIFRLSHKLNTRIGGGSLAPLPLDENPLADWSAGLFLVGRTPYIHLSNTKALYSTVLPGAGVTDANAFIERALGGIRALLEADGRAGVYARFVAPAGGSVRFAKSLNRSVTGSMNDLTRHAAYWLAEGDVSPSEIGPRLQDIPMSALRHDGSAYGFPRGVFEALVKSAGGERPMSDA